jgi:hypothetical protein
MQQRGRMQKLLVIPLRGTALPDRLACVLRTFDDCYERMKLPLRSMSSSAS